MFHVEKTYGENLLANICLKVNEIELFKRIFRIMEKSNTCALRSLMTTKITIDDKKRYPLEICLYTLESRINGSTSQEAENICLEKIKTLLCFLIKFTHINALRILEMLNDFPNIMKHNTCLIKKFIEFINIHSNIKELLLSNSYLINNSIEDRYNGFTKILLSYTNLEQKTLSEYLTCALKYSNYNIITYLIKKGANLEDIEDKYKFINIAIATDNLRLYQRLTVEDEYKYYIWRKKYTSNSPPLQFDMPINYRALHLACAFESIKIAKYLIDDLGDSLSYRGQADMSPQDILEKAVNLGNITQTFANEITTPKISYQKFQEEDKLKQKECCICLDGFCGHEITMLECGHAFHASCLRKNKETSLDCPYCRAPVIHKNNSVAKLGLLKKKKKYKPLDFAISMCYQEEKPKVCIPVKSKTAEDASSYHMYQGDVLEKLERDEYEKKNQEFLEKMEIAERSILIEQVRKILVKNKIGKRPKNMNPSSLYSFRNQEKYHHPPGTPVPMQKTLITTKILANKYNIYQSNIITGVRRTRGVRPKYLINEC